MARSESTSITVDDVTVRVEKPYDVTASHDGVTLHLDNGRVHIDATAFEQAQRVYAEAIKPVGEHICPRCEKTMPTAAALCFVCLSEQMQAAS